MAADASEFGIVMPFVVCASQGGPFDDTAYVAGFEIGTVWTVLQYVPYQWTPDVPIRTANRAQADLVAMHWGFVAEFVDGDDGEWTTVTFTRMDQDAEVT